MESVLIIRITYLDTDRILIPGVNGVTEPRSDLNYPDRKLLPIFNGKVSKQQSFGKIALQYCPKSCPVSSPLLFY